jgi:hypothetical protein
MNDAFFITPNAPGDLLLSICACVCGACQQRRSGNVGNRLIIMKLESKKHYYYYYKRRKQAVSMEAAGPVAVAAKTCGCCSEGLWLLQRRSEVRMCGEGHEIRYKEKNHIGSRKKCCCCCCCRREEVGLNRNSWR